MRLCFACGKEGTTLRIATGIGLNHRNPRCQRPRYLPKDPMQPRCKRIIMSTLGGNSRRVYLGQVSGNPVICLLDKGSEVTLISENLVQELPMKPGNIADTGCQGDDYKSI